MFSAGGLESGETGSGEWGVRGEGEILIPYPSKGTPGFYLWVERGQDIR